MVALTVKVWLWPGASTAVDGDTEPNDTTCSVATRHGTAPLVPPSEATSPKMTPVHGARGRVHHVDAAEVAQALRQRVRREPAARVDQDHPHPGVQPGLARLLRQNAGLPGQASEPTSRCWPGATLKWKTP